MMIILIIHSKLSMIYFLIFIIIKLVSLSSTFYETSNLNSYKKLYSKDKTFCFSFLSIRKWYSIKTFVSYGFKSFVADITFGCYFLTNEGVNITSPFQHRIPFPSHRPFIPLLGFLFSFYCI